MSDLIDNALSKIKSGATDNINNISLPSVPQLPSTDQLGNQIRQLTSLDLESASELAGLLNEDVANALAKANDVKNKAEEILNKLDSIPTEQDLLLIKQRIKADILAKKAEADRLKQNFEEVAVEEIKEKITELALESIPWPPKIPLVDPKILLFIAYAKKSKLVSQLRQKISRENIKNGVKNFEYPIAKINKEDITSTISNVTPTIDIEIPPLPFKKT